MILKWLLFGAVIYAVYILFFKGKGIVTSSRQNSDKKRDEDSEDMVECCVCGTFVSAKDAYIKNGKFYCSKECMDKG